MMEVSDKTEFSLRGHRCDSWFGERQYTTWYLGWLAIHRDPRWRVVIQKPTQFERNWRRLARRTR
jgi:hypothetical protein